MQFQVNIERNGPPKSEDKATLLEIAKKRSVPAILILDDHKNPVYMSTPAYDILHRLNGSGAMTFPKTDMIPADKIPKEIFDLYNDLKKNFNPIINGGGSKPPSPTALIFFRKQSYCCRGFFLDDPTPLSPKASYVMMLIEKVSQYRQISLKRFKQRFRLTKRQMEILKLLGNGYSNKEIANALFVSEYTVKAHLKQIMKRLAVHTRTEVLSMLFQPRIVNDLESTSPSIITKSFGNNYR